MSGWFFGANRFSEGGPAYHGTRNDHPAAYGLAFSSPFFNSFVEESLAEFSTLQISFYIALKFEKHDKSS